MCLWSNKFCSRVYASHLLDDTEMKEVIASTGIGVESIEFSIAENLDSLREKLEGYRKRLEDMGCGNLTIHGPFLDLNPMTYDSGILEVTRRRYEEAYEAARVLGAKKVVYHTCYVPDVYLLIGWADRVADFYRRFLEGKSGIQVVMENVFDREPEPILEVMEKVQHPDFGFCLDIGHANCFSPQKPAEWAEILKKHIKHLHLHDNLGDKDSHLALGQGNIPVRQVLDIVRAHNPEVTYTIECSRKEDTVRSLNLLHSILTNHLSV